MENLLRGRRLRLIVMLSVVMAQQLEISNFSRFTIVLLNLGYIVLTIWDKYLLGQRSFGEVTGGDCSYVVPATLLVIWMLFDDKSLLLQDLMIVASHLSHYYLTPFGYRFDCAAHGVVTLIVVGYDGNHMTFGCPQCFRQYDGNHMRFGCPLCYPQ